MKCPQCKLGNPETARVCDCGYDFVRQRQDEPPDWSDVSSAGKRRIGPGRQATLFVAGVLCLAFAVLGALPVLGCMLAQMKSRPWYVHLWPALPCALVAGVVLCVMAVKR